VERLLGIDLYQCEPAASPLPDEVIEHDLDIVSTIVHCNFLAVDLKIRRAAA
jgi:hypothetical protein